MNKKNNSQNNNRHILIIKHGSLGDWVLATGAFKLIRESYPMSNIILLTGSYYVPLARNCGWFDEVWTDDRLPWFNLNSTLRVIKKLRSTSYAHVFDLQCSKRTAMYYRFIKDKVSNWYGRANGCSHYVPFNISAHSVELSRDIIKASGITTMPVPDISWLKSTSSDLNIKSFGKFILFIPGCSENHLYKRWTSNGYAKVIDWLEKKRIKSVLIGTKLDKEIIDAIVEKSSANPINLMGKTSFEQIAELATTAQMIIGSDTGPMHLAAATGTSSLALFSAASDPIKSRPWGDAVTILSAKQLSNLPYNKVIAELAKLLCV
jgi:ADP-heptose:LPS heptosyltransferase